MEHTRALILAEETDPRHLRGNFAFVTLPASLPCPPHNVEAQLTPERLSDFREVVERRGLSQGSLIYPLDGRRRVVDLQTGRARWADEGRPSRH